jgi:hypothetical protein
VMIGASRPWGRTAYYRRAAVGAAGSSCKRERVGMGRSPHDNTFVTPQVFNYQ